jgi:flagellar FliJ protein
MLKFKYFEGFMDNNFNFRLQKVLDVKKRNEDIQATNHAKILGEKIRVEKQIIELENQYDEYSKLQYTETDAFMRKIAYNYMNALYQSIQNYKMSLQEIEVRFEKSKIKLIELQTERKSIEKLKEKKYNEFIKNMEEEEAYENDEFAVQSFNKTRLEN